MTNNERNEGAYGKISMLGDVCENSFRECETSCKSIRHASDDAFSANAPWFKSSFQLICDTTLVTPRRRCSVVYPTQVMDPLSRLEKKKEKKKKEEQKVGLTAEGKNFVDVKGLKGSQGLVF